MDCIKTLKNISQKVKKAKREGDRDEWKMYQDVENQSPTMVYEEIKQPPKNRKRN